MKLNKILALILAFVMVFSFAACSSDDGPAQSGDGESQGDPVTGGDEESEGRVLNVHVTAAIDSIDPALTSAGDDFEVIGQMVEGLFQCDASGAAIPGMAESYEVDPETGTWTFHLREAYWSNGDPVTADDFVYAWQRCFTIPAEYVFLFETAGIKNAAAIIAGEKDVTELGVYAADEKTFVVEFDVPCAFFDSLMFFPVFYPVNRAFAEECGELYGSAPEYYLSNGPFALSAYTPAATEFSMVKNENYWDADAVELAGLTYKVILDSQQAYLAYQNNELDVCVLSSELADLLKSDAEFLATESGYLWYMSPNVSQGGAMANVNIRKAIGKAFNKEAVCNNILRNGSVPADFCIPIGLATGPDGLDYRESSGITYNEYDVAEAQALWADGLAELGVDSVELTMIFDDEESIKLVAEFIQQELQTNLPGLTITLQPYPKKQRSDLMKAHDYDIGLCRWGPDYADPLTYLDLWTDGYTHNYGDWHSDAYMEILDKIKTVEYAVDPEARWELIKQAEQIIADESVIMPVYQNCNATLVKSDVDGIEFHSVGLNRVFKNVKVG
ncbi:MAG: peptide ABC transporter substrate-binding protein [Oscillospiraceae bacterium]|nr:peptide ABC transporter substrate-binding protein [Oscillospiraceae bacterium]